MPGSDRTADGAMIHRFFRVDKQQIAYLRFTFEAYDGLVFMRTLRAADGLIEVAYPPQLERDAETLLAAIDAEIGLAPAAPPPAEDYDPL